jgi:hypothetical protein
LGYFAKVVRELVGNAIELPSPVTNTWPELAQLNYRRAGLPLRIGGMLLGQATVAAVTLGRTIFLAPATRLDPELLLHEFRHVQQFSKRKTFPLHYIWESLRRGYHANRYEVDARDYAARRIGRITVNSSEEDA